MAEPQTTGEKISSWSAHMEKKIPNWPVPLEKKLLEEWRIIKSSTDKTMTSDVLRRKRLMERMVTYQTTLPESQRWKPLSSFADKQLKNKIDHLFKTGKAEIKRHIVPLLSGQRSAEKNWSSSRRALCLSVPQVWSCLVAHVLDFTR